MQTRACLRCSVRFIRLPAQTAMRNERRSCVTFPKLSAYSSEVSSNKALFARIETVWEQRDSLGLTQEQARVLMLCRRRFVRSGAKLEGAAADRLAEVISRLSILGTTFSQNVLADERSWFLELTPQDLEGLPSFVHAAAMSAGKSKGVEGPAVTLSRSLLMSVLKFAPNRALRKAVYEAWENRGANGGDSDNRGIAAEILQLREERATLLGYASFADFKLETEMAKTPGAVRELLQRVWAPARAAAERDAHVSPKCCTTMASPVRFSRGTGDIIPRSGGRPSMIWMKPS